MNKNEIIKLIEEAFKNVHLGNGIGIRQAQAIDDYQTDEAVKKSRELDEKNNWKDISPDSLDKFYSSLSFFDAEGMRFHIPAYLICDLKGLLKTADPVFILRHGLDVNNTDGENSGKEENALKWWNYANERFSILNADQRNAVREYLRYKMSLDDINKVNIERALENYWSK